MKDFVTAGRVVERLPGLTSIARIKNFAMKGRCSSGRGFGLIVFSFPRKKKSISSSQHFYRVTKMVSKRLVEKDHGIL